MSTSTDGVDVVVCGECGSANDADVSFCGACGAYLEWEGERLQPGRPASPVEEVEPPPDKHSLLDRVRAGLGIEADAAAPPDGANRGSGDDPMDGAAASAAPSAAPEATLATTAESPDAATARRASPAIKAASAPLQPRVAQPGTGQPAALKPAAGQPIAVKPAAEAPRSRKKVAVVDEHRPQAGETVCRECGAGNAPIRKFCRRCGTDLVDAVVVPPLPWWRRVLRRRPRAVTPAGTRPTVRRRSRLPKRLIWIAVVIGALLLAGRLAWPWVSMPFDTVRDRLAGSEPVNPTAAVASSAAPGRGPALTRDRATYTSWSPAGRGSGAGQYVQHTFSDPFRLVALQIYNGQSQNPRDYLKTARLQKVLVTIGRSNGTLESQPITLRDEPGMQNFTFSVSDVTSLRFTVQSAYGATPRTRIALAEVVALKRS